MPALRQKIELHDVHVFFFVCWVLNICNFWTFIRYVMQEHFHRLGPLPYPESDSKQVPKLLVLRLNKRSARFKKHKNQQRPGFSPACGSHYYYIIISLCAPPKSPGWWRWAPRNLHPPRPFGLRSSFPNAEHRSTPLYSTKTCLNSSITNILSGSKSVCYNCSIDGFSF